MTKKARPLTEKQQKVLDFQRVFLCCNHQLPPGSAIAAAFGWKSTNAAYDVLKMLEKKHHLQRNGLGNLMLSDQVHVVSTA